MLFVNKIETHFDLKDKPFILIDLAISSRDCSLIKLEYKNIVNENLFCRDTTLNLQNIKPTNMTFDSIASIIEDLNIFKTHKKVLIDGCEPLDSISNPTFVELVSHLISSRYELYIKTNGSIDIPINKLSNFIDVRFIITLKEDVADKCFWLLNPGTECLLIYGINTITTDYIKRLKKYGLRVTIIPQLRGDSLDEIREKEAMQFAKENNCFYYKNKNDNPYLGILTNRIKAFDYILENPLEEESINAFEIEEQGV